LVKGQTEGFERKAETFSLNRQNKGGQDPGNKGKATGKLKVVTGELGTAWEKLSLT